MRDAFVQTRMNPDGKTVDEVVADGVRFHIEQMDDTGFWIGLDAPDGRHWSFWIGSKNKRSHVDLIVTDRPDATTPPAPLALSRSGEG